MNINAPAPQLAPGNAGRGEGAPGGGRKSQPKPLSRKAREPAAPPLRRASPRTDVVASITARDNTPSSLQREYRAGGRVHTPSRVAPHVGRHQLPQGSSTYLRATGSGYDVLHRLRAFLARAHGALDVARVARVRLAAAQKHAAAVVRSQLLRVARGPRLRVGVVHVRSTGALRHLRMHVTRFVEPALLSARLQTSSDLEPLWTRKQQAHTLEKHRSFKPHSICSVRDALGAAAPVSCSASASTCVTWRELRESSVGGGGEKRQ